MLRNNYIHSIFQVIIIVYLPIVILLSILQVYALNENFYTKEFKKNHVSENTKIELEDLNRITTELIDYLKDRRNDLNIFAEIKGKKSTVFGEREKKHMKDVKKLFQRGFILRNVGIVLLIGALLGLSKISENANKAIYQSLLGSSILSLGIMIFIFVLIQEDFYKYFTYFHKIFFENDLWMLNPKTDILIQMLPLDFFYDIATRVIGSFVGIMFSIGGISFYKLRKS
ncbi:TIGR01906 family membrane protein [Crassaminicella thermophila]|uniref:TIGR01906 family membrane protein n=1 Tax=Crassaminicella thermophila TaxID=2599308 RepID=A0A5C0SCE2_CRATE|nr:TIGR01906 family membrane protein [Crassaminicella thermophila]QEK11750.1 TIGR01906 family membrane protein [Crassaminicella thermophila]